MLKCSNHLLMCVSRIFEEDILLVNPLLNRHLQPGFQRPLSFYGVSESTDYCSRVLCHVIIAVRVRARAGGSGLSSRMLSALRNYP